MAPLITVCDPKNPVKPVITSITKISHNILAPVAFTTVFDKILPGFRAVHDAKVACDALSVSSALIVKRWCRRMAPEQRLFADQLLGLVIVGWISSEYSG
jgi:hypothetical protein